MAHNRINTLYKKWREAEDPALDSYDPYAAHDALAAMLPQVEGYVTRVARKLSWGDGAVAGHVREDTIGAVGEILDAALRNGKATDPAIERWETFTSFLETHILHKVRERYAYHMREGRGGPGRDPRRTGEGKAWIGTQSLDDENPDGFSYAQTLAPAISLPWR